MHPQLKVRLRLVICQFHTLLWLTQRLQRKLAFKQVHEKFKIDALDNINVNFQSGKVTGLVGGNGAGKSTLLKTIVGVLKPSAGTVKLWGRPHLLTLAWDLTEFFLEGKMLS